METEEDLLTSLQIKFYHPQQNCKGFYGRLPLGTRRRHAADDPLRLGRDDQTCAYILLDPRVSRKQLALYAYHIPQSSEMLFTIQNLSQRGKLSVNSSALGYLEKMDLPDKALIRFGEYEILIIRESGEAKANFEVEFGVLAVPPSRETSLWREVLPAPQTSMSLWKEQGSMSLPPVMETCSDSRISLSPEDSSFGPQESDETLPCDS